MPQLLVAARTESHLREDGPLNNSQVEIAYFDSKLLRRIEKILENDQKRRNKQKRKAKQLPA